MKRSTFIILCLEGAVLSFNVAACAALVPSIAREFALSQFLVGKIVWIYMIPYGIAALIYGPLVRAIDAKKVELVCLFVFSCANLMVAFSRNISELFWGRFLMGAFGASVIPLGLILIARHTEAAKRGRKVGIFFGATFVASLLGLFLSGIISWRLIFLFPAIAGFLLCVGIIFWLPSFGHESGGFRVQYLQTLREKRIFSIFVYIFLISLIYHGAQQWLAVYFSRQFNLPQFKISMLITLTSLSGIFGEVIGGWLADFMGRIKTVNLGILLMVASVFLILLKLPVWVFAVLMILWGFGWTLNHSGVSTLLADLPEEHLNEAASLNSSVRFISGGLGVAFGGVLMQKSFVFGFSSFGVGLIILWGLAGLLLTKK